MRRRFTKALLHEKYYIQGVNRLIDRVLRKCVECQKDRHQTIVQPTGDLPAFLTKGYLPFECVGVDNFGPLKMANNLNVWMLLVTCAVSRAVHLDPVLDLTAEACLVALHAAFNLRGYPRIVVSDNGTNFTKVEKDLRKLLRLLKSDVSTKYLEVSMKWYFNPPAIPLMGWVL